MAINLPDTEFVRAKYIGRRGNHHVIGAHTFQTDPGLPSRLIGGVYKLYYGYIQAGRIIDAVHREDVRLMVNKWEVLPEIKEPPQPSRTPIEPPKVITPPKILEEVKEVESFELEKVPGVTKTIAGKLRQAGYDSPQAIIKAGIQGLSEIKGVSESRAKIIIKFFND